MLDPSQPLVPGNVFETKWDAFVRPYPRAVAGTPRHWHYDPKTRQFTLSYTPTRADGAGRHPATAETEVFLPPRHYPGCYRATAQGARVTSPPGDPRFRLLADLAAAEIHVQVTPC